MFETKKKFFLYDRWYYLIKNTQDKVVYSSSPETKQEGNLIEIDKNTHDIGIIYFINKKASAKLKITDFDTLNPKFKYSQYECSDLIIDNELYSNLLIELNIETQNGRINDNSKISLTKKKKIKRICYREPKISLNKKHALSSINFKSEPVENIIKFIEVFKLNIKTLSDAIKVEENQTLESKPREVVRLETPQSLYVYDRAYHLIESFKDKYIYENAEEEIMNLEIKIDTNNQTLAYIKLQEKDSIYDENYKHIIELVPTKENGVCIKYRNLKSLNILANSEMISKAKLQAELVYDSENTVVEDTLEIESKHNKYKLNAHPILLSEYLDKEGNLYHISNSAYARFQCIAPLAFHVFKNIEKGFFQEKELIKK